MIAKYSGTCKVTGLAIVAGQTELSKINGVWQVKPLSEVIVPKAATIAGRQLSLKEYDALPKGTKVNVYSFDGKTVKVGLICKRAEQGPRHTAIHSVVSVDGYSPSDIALMFIRLPE